MPIKPAPKSSDSQMESLSPSQSETLALLERLSIPLSVRSYLNLEMDSVPVDLTEVPAEILMQVPRFLLEKEGLVEPLIS